MSRSPAKHPAPQAPVPPSDLRDNVAAVLEELSGPDGPLSIDSDAATWRRHTVAGTNPYDARYTPGRLRVHQALSEDYLASQSDIVAGGLAVVVTAGPPAAGKSTVLDELGYRAGWRRIDADSFKTMLIQHDLKTGDIHVVGTGALITRYRHLTGVESDLMRGGGDDKLDSARAGSSCPR